MFGKSNHRLIVCSKYVKESVLQVKPWIARPASLKDNHVEMCINTVYSKLWHFNISFIF